MQNQIYLSYAEAQPLLQAQPEIITKNLFNEFLAMQVDEVQIHPPVFVFEIYTFHFRTEVSVFGHCLFYILLIHSVLFLWQRYC